VSQITEDPQVDRHLLDNMKERVAMSCRILAQHGLMRGSTGHVSERIPNTNEMMVRGRPPIDKGLRFADPSTIMRVDQKGQPVGETRGLARVSEINLHTEIYNRRPEVNAVIHAHPPGAVLCTIHNIPLKPIYGAFHPRSHTMAMDGVPLYDHSYTIQNSEQMQPLLEIMGSKHVVLMSRHGILVTGTSVEDATDRALTLEFLARMCWITTPHGDPGEISDEDKQEFARRAKESAEARAQGRNRLAEAHPGGFEGVDYGGGGWDYYSAMLESGALTVDDVGLGFGFRL
jgi:ribulose-5-phosphate 4-epimerase/fuculose-1-phosphate aldolase